MNPTGSPFSDVNDLVVGDRRGHHWMARHVPDDAYVTQPTGESDYFNLVKPDRFLCDPDLERFLSQSTIWFWIKKGKGFCPRYAFGSQKRQGPSLIHRGLGPSSVSSILRIKGRITRLRIPWCKNLSQVTIEDVQICLKHALPDTICNSPYGPERRPWVSGPSGRGSAGPTRR